MQIIAFANLSRMRFWRPKLTSIICNFARGIIYDFKFQILFVNNYHQLSTIIYNQKRAALSHRLSRSPCESRRWMARLSKLNAPFPATSLVSSKDWPAAYKKHDVCDILQKIVPLRYTFKNPCGWQVTYVCNYVFESECNERFFVRAKPVFL